MNLFSVNIAYAATSRFDTFISNVDSKIINPLIILLFVLAIAYFLWGVFQFISNQDNEEKKTDGKNHMIYGILGLVIMISVWAILQVILNTLDIQKSGQINPEEGTVHLNDYNPPSSNN
ncbi:MAG: pilin [Patescibacteria group bacterium]